MLSILGNITFRRLFAAQVSALLGTGLLTVALGLLALDLVGSDAAMVLGTILTIKMIAYVTVAPIAGAMAERLPRRAVLISLDLVRAATALCLPFVDAAWQAYLLVLILQSASAAFTPTFQATIPEVLPDEGDYTRALSLSRLAHDLETLASPAFAAVLLLVLSYNALFAGTAIGFVASAALVWTTRLPAPAATDKAAFGTRITKGLRIYLTTPRLRALLGLNLAVAAGGAMVIVNTVALVKLDLGLGDAALSLSLAAFGAGSMLMALILPSILDRGDMDRATMLGGAATLLGALAVFAAVWASGGPSWTALLFAWVVAGLGYSAVLTPAGRLLRRSAHPRDRPALFAAQFTLSHACWLLAYPLAGWLMTAFGPAIAASGLAVLGLTGLACAFAVWPSHDPQILEHQHDGLPPDHPHLDGGEPHAHDFRIDGLHRSWPNPRA